MPTSSASTPAISVGISTLRPWTGGPPAAGAPDDHLRRRTVSRGRWLVLLSRGASRGHRTPRGGLRRHRGAEGHSLLRQYRLVAAVGDLGGHSELRRLQLRRGTLTLPGSPARVSAPRWNHRLGHRAHGGLWAGDAVRVRRGPGAGAAGRSLGADANRAGGRS